MALLPWPPIWIRWRVTMCFALDEAKEIAAFIEKRYLRPKDGKQITTLLINGNQVQVKTLVQEALAATVHGFVSSDRRRHRGN